MTDDEIEGEGNCSLCSNGFGLPCGIELSDYTEEHCAICFKKYSEKTMENPNSDYWRCDNCYTCAIEIGFVSNDRFLRLAKKSAFSDVHNELQKVIAEKQVDVIEPLIIPCISPMILGFLV